MFEWLFKLLIGHAFADFAFQHHNFALGKNRHNDPPGYKPEIHGKKQAAWIYYLAAHALIHGGLVYAITGHIALGFIETCSHFLIDAGKCERLYGIHVDQALHFIFKASYALALVTYG